MKKVSLIKKQMKSIQQHRWLPDPNRRDRVFTSKKVYSRKKRNYD